MSTREPRHEGMSLVENVRDWINNSYKYQHGRYEHEHAVWKAGTYSTLQYDTVMKC